MTSSPSRYLYVLVIVCAFLISLLVINNMQKEEKLDKTVLEPKRSVYTGAWVGGYWEDTTRTLNVDNLKAFENEIEYKVAIANVYVDWTYLGDSKLLEALNTISSNGWVPMISSNPKSSISCDGTKTPIYKVIAQGTCDEFIRELARNLKAYKEPLFLRFAWEMNLPDIYWSVDYTGSTPEEFNAAWRRIHNIFEEENVDNIQWVLSFNTSSKKTIPYEQLYPGDDFVDWVAIDGYNWGTSQPWSGWTSFSSVFKNSYDELAIITEKPIMLSEVNSSPEGGDKTAWLVDMLSTQIPLNFPRIEAIVFFNENKASQESVDWRIEISDDYTTALKTHLRTELYKSFYP